MKPCRPTTPALDLILLLVLEGRLEGTRDEMDVMFFGIAFGSATR